ncbi:MAG: hypothetical protein J6W84_06230 [Bacteroidales bacterium]|nr:hypothetical protein [Bacteroidales bacterium]
MDTSIIVSVISAIAVVVTGILTYLGVRASNRTTRDTMTNALATQFEKYTAVTDTKIDNLTREVRQHNNFAVEIPAIKQQIVDIKEDIRELKCS